MALTFYNNTCDIYRSGHAPPAAPDVAGVKCLLAPKGASTLTTPNFTHILLVPPGTDIRDGTGYLAPGVSPDTFYIPDKNGTKFQVLLVRRKGKGTALDHLECIAQRSTPTWPTQNL
jgi:hypothetical protein